MSGTAQENPSFCLIVWADGRQVDGVSGLIRVCECVQA